MGKFDKDISLWSTDDMLKRLRRKYHHHKNHHKHKKHLSKKWGFIILTILLLGLVILVPQLNKTQDPRSKAVFYEGTEVKNVLAKCTTSEGSKGYCLNIKNQTSKPGQPTCASIGGKYFEKGHCQGSNNIQCCVTSIATPQECKEEGLTTTGNEGICEKVIPGSKRMYAGGLCPGPDKVKCYLPEKTGIMADLSNHRKIDFTRSKSCDPYIDMRNQSGFNQRYKEVISRKLLLLMKTIADEYGDKIGISCIMTGHKYKRTGEIPTDIPRPPSDHSLGKAFDVNKVGGQAVRYENKKAQDLVQWLYDNRMRLGIKEVLSPWAHGDYEFGKGFGTNADHLDHIHIAVY